MDRFSVRFLASRRRVATTFVGTSLLAALAACGGGGYGGGTSAGNNAALAPAIATAPASVTVPAGQSASFTVSATGYPPLSYQWIRGTNDIQGATSSTYTLAATPADNGATFAVRVTNAYGNVTSAPATLTVQ